MEPTTTVPMFESNQILSSTHLNQLRDYLDAEIKISRTRLTGVGIINGLNIKLYDKAAGKIVVTTGYGITTSGYLLELHPEAETCENTYQYYRPYFDPFDPEYNFGEKDIPKSDSSSSGSETILPAADSKSKFSPQSVKPAKASANPKKLVKGGGSEAEVVPTIFELLTEEEAADADDAKFLSLFGDELDKMAVVLFLEEKSVELKTCTGTNCDNKGHKLELTVRLLLVPKDRLHTYDPQSLLTVPDPLSYISIPALSNDDLVAMNSSADLRNGYKTKVIEPQKTRLNDAIKQAYTNYGYLLGLSGKEVSDVPNWISNIDKGLQYIQYAMDALNDVTLTFNEFAEAAYDFFLTCGPVIFPFPRHLTLGLLQPTRDFIFDEYRTVLFQAPPIDRQDRKLVQTQLLFEKMLVLLKSFHVPGETGESPVDLKITPSKLTPVLLSERSLPFYYDIKNINTILQTWNPWQTLRGRQKERMGYFADTYSSAPEFKKPFSYSTAEFPFLRIEGLGGKDKDDVLQTLEKLKQEFNLAFDVIALRIDAEEFMLDETTDCRFGDLEEEYLFHRQALLDTVRALEDYFELINYYVYNTTDKKSKLKFEMAGEYITHFSQQTNSVLPPCLRDFDYSKFKQAYKDLIGMLLEFFRSSGLQHKLFESIAPRDGKNADSAMSVLLSLASSILFTLIDMVYYRKLYRIWVQYTIRYHRSLKQTRFSSFAELNPGMVHRAGLDRGTFIVVYETVKIKKVTETVSGKGKKAMAKKSAMSAAAGPQAIDAVAPAPASRYSILSDSKEPIRFAVETAMPGGKEMTAALKLAEEKYYKLTDKARGKEVTVTEDVIEPPLTSNIVIADFMLPYQCCENYHCMSMCISNDELSVLPIPPFAKDDFALTHVNMPVDIYPDMNDVAGLGNTIEITEIHDNTTITTAMGGSATPDNTGVRPHFIYTPPKNDDGFSDSFQYTIKNSTNGLTDTATVYIEVVPLPPAKISVSNSTVCWNGTAQIINIDAPMRDPAKLKIEGPGVSYDEVSGNWYFDPTGLASGTYELSLSQDNKVIATCNVTVKKPVAGFGLDSIHRYETYMVINLQNKSTEADQFEWSGKQFTTVYTYGMQTASIQVPYSSITKNGTVQVQLIATDSTTGCQSSPFTQNILIPTVSISLSKPVYCISDPAEAFVIQKGGIDTLTVAGPGVSYQNGNWMFDPSQTNLQTSGEIDFKLIDTTTGYTVASTIVRVVIIQPDFEVGTVSAGSLLYKLNLDIAIDPNALNLVSFNFNNLTQPAEADSFSWTAQVLTTKLTSKLRNPTFSIDSAILMEAQYMVNTTLVAKATTLSSCTKTINRQIDLSPYLSAGLLAKNASNTIGLLDTGDYKILSDKVDVLYSNNEISFNSIELGNKLAAAAESANTFVSDPVVNDSVKAGITEQPIDANADALKLLTEAITATETTKSDAVAEVYKATLNNYNSLLAASPNALTKEELVNLETYNKTVTNLSEYTVADKLNTELAIASSTDKATTKYLTDLSGTIG